MSSSQLANPPKPPLHYTGSPLLLCYYDTLLFIKYRWSLFGILNPVSQWHCKELDELYPSLPNIWCLALHGYLIFLQVFFVFSLPILLFVPVGISMCYVAGILATTEVVCWLLNGRDEFLRSKVDLGGDEARFADECWVYCNGVSVGKHWLQQNLERLSLTFRRPIIGVPNRTYGILFDLIQCVLERNFYYATSDVRNAFALIKSYLLVDKYKKVILILHSQGGIEGGLVLDLLLSQLPHDTIQKLEIYTFGSAGNHFNNPYRSTAKMQAGVAREAEAESSILASQPTLHTNNNDKAVRHIEHYAHDGDFVACWGVLSFTHIRDRHMGRVFVRSGMGHLLNQHYLNAMFPLDENRCVKEDNPFMDSDVSLTINGEPEGERAENDARKIVLRMLLNGGNGTVGPIIEDIHDSIEPASLKRAQSVLLARKANREPKVRDFSRLWQYRNGGSPDD